MIKIVRILSVPGGHCKTFFSVPPGKNVCHGHKARSVGPHTQPHPTPPMESMTSQNKGITKSQAQRNCDVISFQSDMGSDQPTDGWTDQPTDGRTNIVSYRGATSRLKILQNIGQKIQL
jgi:hypothetical protein